MLCFTTPHQSLRDSFPPGGSLCVRHVEHTDKSKCVIFYSTPYSDIIQKIVIEDGVRVIGNLAFYNLDCAVEIVIPESVKTIGTQFIRGTSIKEVTLPAVKVIKDMAFASADKLETVIAGESVCDIRGKIFYSETVKVKAPMDSYIANYVRLFDELYTTSATVTLEEVGAAETPVIYFAKVG